MDDEAKRRLHKKNVAMALSIVGFIVLVFIVSLVRMSGG